MRSHPASYGERCAVALCQLIAVAGFIAFMVTLAAIIRTL